METNQKSFRRIVTGHDTAGKAVITSDAVAPRTYMVGGPNGAKFFEVWNTEQTPAIIDNEPFDKETTLILAPPKGGTLIRVIDFPPEDDKISNLTKEEAQKHFKSMTGEQALNFGNDAPHPLMHRTQTVDYGIVIEGELTLILDCEETIIKTGDIVIQRGTNHAWANRTNKICRVAFILIDGQFEKGLL